MRNFTLINEKEIEQWYSKKQYEDPPYPPKPLEVWQCNTCGSKDCMFHVGTQENSDSHMKCNQCLFIQAV